MLPKALTEKTLRTNSVLKNRFYWMVEALCYLSKNQRVNGTLPVTFLKEDIFSSFQEVEDGFDGVREGLSYASLKVNQALFQDGIEGAA